MKHSFRRLLFGSLTVTLCGLTPLAARATTREELAAFVKEAHAFATSHPKAEALRAFDDPKGHFIRGELYVFAFDFKGVCLAHGASPVLAGKDMADMTDRSGTKAIRQLADIAKKGEGHVEYLWQNPVTKSYDKKLSHVVKVDESWFLGAGIYLGPADPSSLKR